jgi:flagellin
VADQDHYYISTDDTRATSTSGLRIGGDAKNDVWSTGNYGDIQGKCCVQTIKNLNSAVVKASGQAFAYGYNWDLGAASDQALLTSKYLAGRYGIDSGMTYEQVIAAVNNGTQSRIVANIGTVGTLAGDDFVSICLGTDELYFGGSAAASAGKTGFDSTKVGATMTAVLLASAINGNADSKYWAMVSGTQAIIFRKDGGNNNGVKIELDSRSSAVANTVISFTDPKTGATTSGSAYFTLGGEHWGTLETTALPGGYSLTLLGRDTGDGRDLYIAASGGNATNTAFGTKLTTAKISDRFLTGLNGDMFSEIQNAADGPWDGAHIRTQEAGQKALDAVSEAIKRKDSIRAGLGAFQNLLESTMETLTIQVENLQAAESRISDVDVAREMTEFTKGNVLAQAAASMLAQANSLTNLALTIIMGY